MHTIKLSASGVYTSFKFTHINARLLLHGIKGISSYPAETTERLQGSDCSEFQQPEKRQYISILTTATERTERER